MSGKAVAVLAVTERRLAKPAEEDSGDVWAAVIPRTEKAAEEDSGDVWAAVIPRAEKAAEDSAEQPLVDVWAAAEVAEVKPVSGSACIILPWQKFS